MLAKIQAKVNDPMTKKMGKQNKMLAVSTLSTVHEEFGG
jgi:hypothetical protein